MTNEIAETGELDEELKKSLALTAKEDAALEKSDIKFLSIKGSKFALGEDKLGKELDVVILSTAFDNAFYDRPYNPDVITPPACFAISTDSTEMYPHESSPDKQATSCDICPNNQFGSSGKGKACKNGRRLLLASYNSDDGVDLSSPVTLRIPPTSLKNYSSYVRKLAAGNMPVFSVVTTIGFDENEDYPKIVYKTKSTLGPSVLGSILDRRREFSDIVTVPYDTSTYEPPGQASEKLQ
jgi:hypothetical protein